MEDILVEGGRSKPFRYGEGNNYDIATAGMKLVLTVILAICKGC